MSKTIIALILVIAGFVGLADIMTEAEVAKVVDAGMQIIGIFGVWYGRYTSSGKEIDVLGVYTK